MAKRTMLGDITKTMTDAATAATEAVIGMVEAPFATNPRARPHTAAKKPGSKRAPSRQKRATGLTGSAKGRATTAGSKKPTTKKARGATRPAKAKNNRTKKKK